MLTSQETVRLEDDTGPMLDLAIKFVDLVNGKQP
jgi:hypothetical protein